MRKGAYLAGSAFLLGGVIGTLCAMRWAVITNSLRSDYSSAQVAHGLSFFAAVLLALSVYAAWVLASRALVLRTTDLIMGSISLITAAVAYAALQSVRAASLSAGSYEFPIIMTAALIGAVLLRRTKSAAALCILIAASALPYTHSLSLITSDSLARAASKYSAPIGAAHYLELTASIIYLIVLASAVFCAIDKRNPVRISLRAGLAAFAVAIVFAVVQTNMYYVSMGSGGNVLSVFAAAVLPWLILAPITALCAREWLQHRQSLLIRLAPAFVLVLFFGYFRLVSLGYNDFASIRTLYPDGATAYIHFAADGTLRRTLDQTASSARQWRAQYFLDAYPYSAYKPAAMLAFAQCAFDNWEFDSATNMLDLFRHAYPDLDDESEILLALSGIAEGDPGAILRPAAPNSYFARWRNTQGSQIAAAAALRLGLKGRARGYTSAYMDYLNAQQPVSWTRSSLSYSGCKLNYLIQTPETAQSLRRTAVVTVRVLVGDKPLPDVKVVLVQPHADAALPDDSQQFTGAWSLPAWNGMWAATDKYGTAHVSGVPYGTYELVLGLGIRNAPLGYVVSSNIEEVSVSTSAVLLPPVRMVRGIRLLWPTSGGSVTSSPELCWSVFPGAASYSVSVIATSRGSMGRNPGPSQPTGTTCWAKSGILSNRCIVDPGSFVSGSTKLESGRTYMWVVYAYKADGSLLASSEHYFQLHEPTFVVR